MKTKLENIVERFLGKIAFNAFIPTDDVHMTLGKEEIERSNYTIQEVEETEIIRKGPIVESSNGVDYPAWLETSDGKMHLFERLIPVDFLGKSVEKLKGNWSLVFHEAVYN